MTSSKETPILNDTTHSDYLMWKKEVAVWQLGTNAKNTQQAAKLIMNMSGKPREVSINLPVDVLGGEDGVKKLIEELDKLYCKDSTQSLFKAIDSFESYRRAPSEDIDKYILEFLRKYKYLKQLQENKELYGEAILAYRLLNQASLTQEQQRLVRATCTVLTLEKMQEQLKRTFGDSIGERSSSDLPFKTSQHKEIKSEPIFYAREGGKTQGPNFQHSEDNYQHHRVQEEDEHVYWSGDYNNTREYQHRPDHHYPYWNSYHPDRAYRQNNNRYNPYALNNNQRSHQQRGNKRPYQQRGNEDPMKSPKRRSPKKKTCFICDKPDHFCAQCPELGRLYNKDQQTQSETHNRKVYFQTMQPLSDVQSLSSECVDQALLDTGSSHTICGETWLKEFQSSLQPEDLANITSEVCNMTFCFGDIDLATARTKVSIPVMICEEKTMLEVYVVDRNIPLLLAFDSMKKLGMMIDLPHSKISIKGNYQDLTLTETGHSLVAISGNTGLLETTATSTLKEEEELKLVSCDKETATETVKKNCSELKKKAHGKKKKPKKQHMIDPESIPVTENRVDTEIRTTSNQIDRGIT